MAGDLVLYSADNRNIHCVDEILDGERLTLTMWFSRNNSYDEDAKLISLMDQTILKNEPASCSHAPLTASSNMYWFSSDHLKPDQLQGFDIRFGRLFSLGFDIFPVQGNTSTYYEINSSTYVCDVLNEPLRLVREDKLLDKEFANLLHALQAVQFYYWNQSNLQQSDGVRSTSDVILLSEVQKQDVLNLKCLLSRSIQLDSVVFRFSFLNTIEKPHFDWDSFCACMKSWEGYTLKLHQQLKVHLPLWKEYNSLFSVSSSVAKEQAF